MNARTVIVTDGNERAALAVVRSLGAAGYRCIVVSATGHSIAGGSRHAVSDITAPSPLAAPDAFADAVCALVEREHATLLYPITEAAMLALLAVRDRVPDCVIPFPGIDTFRAISDKQRLLAAAASLGIAVPSQVVLDDANPVRTLRTDQLNYPVVLKPARSVGESDGKRTSVGVDYARSPDELRNKLAALVPYHFPLLLQQRIVGPGIGIFVLLWNDEVRASFAHRRLVEKPPSGGVSVYRESAAMDGDLLDRSVALLRQFHWRGVAMVEYKRDARTGQPYLMEINGRFWGSLQLAIDAGVDFPRLLAAADTGARPVQAYRIGVRSRWSWGLVDHLVARVRRNKAAGALPEGTVSVPRVIADLLLGPLRHADYEEVLRWNDPLPFWRETVRWFRAL